MISDYIQSQTKKQLRILFSSVGVAQSQVSENAAWFSSLQDGQRIDPWTARGPSVGAGVTVHPVRRPSVTAAGISGGALGLLTQPCSPLAAHPSVFTSSTLQHTATVQHGKKKTCLRQSNLKDFLWPWANELFRTIRAKFHLHQIKFWFKPILLCLPGLSWPRGHLGEREGTCLRQCFSLQPAGRHKVLGGGQAPLGPEGRVSDLEPDFGFPP